MSNIGVSCVTSAVAVDSLTSGLWLNRSRTARVRFKNTIFCGKVSFNIPSCSNILSHSSRMKCFTFFKINFLLLMRANRRPKTVCWSSQYSCVKYLNNVNEQCTFWQVISTILNILIGGVKKFQTIRVHSKQNLCPWRYQWRCCAN